ncbi:hypothetical protein FPV67DRAFT_1670184 [Lyophyllum atratum]|nr:hypothetical protein FPV67DRAFT_1670184 [Lyophyllum atratum]
MSSFRLGGYILPDGEVIKWAARLSGKPEGEISFEYAIAEIQRHLTKRGVRVSMVEYPTDVDAFMVVTRRAPHYGWRSGDDPSRLKQYQLTKVEEYAKQALTGEGVKDFQFVTAHGYL